MNFESDDLPTLNTAPLAARTSYGLMVLCFAIFVAALFIGGFQDKLKYLGIPTMSPVFADVRTITGGAETVQMGLDPMVQNPADPWARPMNYPRLWQELYEFGINKDSAPLLAGSFIALFMVGLACLTPLLQTMPILGWMILAVLSPVTWLALERGNTDLAMFGLLGLAVLAVSRLPWLASILIVTAGALKLFPIFALSGLYRNGTRRNLVPAFIGGMLFVGYIFIIRHDLAKIAAATPDMIAVSYGIGVLPAAIAKQLGVAHLAGLLKMVGLGIITLLAVWVFLLRRRHTLTDADEPLALAAFRMGAAVYVGSFLLGNNFDYRMIFLIFCIPMLCHWRNHTTHPRLGKLLLAVLVCLSLSMWSMAWTALLKFLPMGSILALLIDEALNIGLLLGLGGLLVLSLKPIARV